MQIKWMLENFFFFVLDREVVVPAYTETVFLGMHEKPRCQIDGCRPPERTYEWSMTGGYSLSIHSTNRGTFGVQLGMGRGNKPFLA